MHKALLEMFWVHATLVYSVTMLMTDVQRYGILFYR